MKKKLTCACGVVSVLLLVCSSGKLVSQDPPKTKTTSKKQSGKAKHKADPSTTKCTKTQQIVRLLNQEVDISLLKELPQMSLKQMCKLLQYELPETKGRISFVVDDAKFASENPDAPYVMETEVSVLDLPQKLPLAFLLRKSLGRVPTRNATYIVRRGIVEITPLSQVAPRQLLSVKVTGVFINEPLVKAVQELGEQTGAGIIIDPRAGDKARTPITATFSHNVSLDAALIILTDMAGLKSVTLGRSFYITTPENARNLRSEHNRLKKKKYQAPGFGPSAPGLGI